MFFLNSFGKKHSVVTWSSRGERGQDLLDKGRHEGHGLVDAHPQVEEDLDGQMEAGGGHGHQVGELAEELGGLR